MSRVNLGLLLLRLERQEYAAIEFRRALPHADGNAAALSAIGNGLRRTRQFDVAVEAMNRAIAASPHLTTALLSELALAQRAAGDREGAVRSLTRALEMEPRYSIAHYLLANILAGSGQYQQAIGHYEQYLEIEPNGEEAPAARERLERARQALQRE
jgi:tetratricopeptide (TPR) repeat protein